MHYCRGLLCGPGEQGCCKCAAEAEEGADAGAELGTAAWRGQEDVEAVQICNPEECSKLVYAVRRALEVMKAEREMAEHKVEQKGEEELAKELADLHTQEERIRSSDDETQEREDTRHK